MTVRAFYHNTASGPHTNDESRPVPPDVLHSLGYQFWSTEPDPTRERVIEELTKKAKEQGFQRSDTDAIAQVNIDFSNLEVFGGDNKALEKEKSKFAQYFTWGHEVIVCALEGEKIVYLEGPSRCSASCPVAALDPDDHLIDLTQSDPNTVIRYIHKPGDCVLGLAGAYRQVFYLGGNKDLVIANIPPDEKPQFITEKEINEGYNDTVRKKYLAVVG
ncbi:hypothetical protein PQX77_002207 [Marasmius sp. AFHP31]|nr:hypothetical protein PQX77_002207 [Marasmius sp. AFHP31]